jgi:long-chain acyl-CoA synthetase
MVLAKTSCAAGFDEAELASLLAKTLPALLLERARDVPDVVAFRDKRLGIYAGTSWREYAQHVEEIARGLESLGVVPGDRVAIMGDPCPEWMLCDLAVMSLGAITVGVYPTSSPQEVSYTIKDSGAKIFIAETQEHLDKVLASFDPAWELQGIVVVDTRALFSFAHDLVISLQKLQETGRIRSEDDREFFGRSVGRISPDDGAAIVYTSGTTGPPKGAVLTHRNLIAAATAYVTALPSLRVHEHRMVAHLPLSHVVARVTVAVVPLIARLVPFFCEDIDEFTETIREVAPTFVLMPPRFYEKFAAQLAVGIDTSTPLKRWSYRRAYWLGELALKKAREGERLNPATRLLVYIARQLVFKQLLEKVGLAHAGIVFTGSAPMPPQVVEFWHTWGLDLREVYGVTESCGIPIGQFHAFPAPNDIGEPTSLAGFEVRLSDKGEILLRSPMVFARYWNSPAATDEVLDKEGWYHTGDVGEITPKGHIKLVDRMRDIIVTSGGKTLSPQQIERVIRGSPYISETIVFGHGRKFVTALLELDYTTVSEWARTAQIPYTSYTNLVTRPEVVELISKEVERCNQELARVEQLKAFRIIPVELDPEQGETTPTRKIKRGLTYKMFEELVESMYDDKGGTTLQQVSSGKKAAVAV